MAITVLFIQSATKTTTTNKKNQSKQPSKMDVTVVVVGVVAAAAAHFKHALHVHSHLLWWWGDCDTKCWKHIKLSLENVYQNDGALFYTYRHTYKISSQCRLLFLCFGCSFWLRIFSFFLAIQMIFSLNFIRFIDVWNVSETFRCSFILPIASIPSMFRVYRLWFIPYSFIAIICLKKNRFSLFFPSAFYYFHRLNTIVFFRVVLTWPRLFGSAKEKL